MVEITQKNIESLFGLASNFDDGTNLGTFITMMIAGNLVFQQLPESHRSCGSH